MGEPSEFRKITLSCKGTIRSKRVYFSETIIIFTSNIGASKVQAGLTNTETSKQFIAEVKNHFVQTLGRPELLNRIGDNIVAFNFINNPAIFTKIARIKFKTIADFVKESYHADIVFSNKDEAFIAIANNAGVANGGRGLLNVMESVIVNPLAEFIFNKSENSYFVYRRKSNI